MRMISRLVALVLSSVPFCSLAGSFSQAQDPVVLAPGTAGISMHFLFAGDGQTQQAQLELTLSSMQGLTITPTVLVPGSVCSVDPGAARLRIQPASMTGVVLPAAATPYCRFSIDVAGDATIGARTFAISALSCAPLGPGVTCNFAGQGLVIANLPLGIPTITGTYVGSAPSVGPIFAGTTRQVGYVDFSILGASAGSSGAVSCTDDAGGAQLTIAPASQTGLTTTVVDPTVSCLITNTQQTGTFTCFAVNGGAMQFTASCPGPLIFPIGLEPVGVPATSAWSKFALVFLLLVVASVLIRLRARS